MRETHIYSILKDNPSASLEYGIFPWGMSKLAKLLVLYQPAAINHSNSITTSVQGALN